jgi:hypothetical protein
MRGIRRSRLAAGSTLTFRTTSNKMIRRGTIIFIGKEGEGRGSERRRQKGF